ncbi:40S small subunit ribosomal protein eS1 (rpS3A) [Andalucia godoyi]|uniref:Small ribosomal subunit protein eS1 n=1 Tax=Andalucia godoyi TaxID=505711 RepID=A0A8K0F284_ANDGO|nr:40S small subunit ribosomal protein eS1 (rpS3A) [Andalucia godoyi]|eukprot:ANDGO_08216.mRNA.1 40S small subunit ribosomal protein eS1 (rpS3A)
MAIGKNKRLSKGKKGGKRKIIDPFSRKEWYHIKAPNYYKNQYVGETIVNRTQGTKIASEQLKGRVFEANLAELEANEEYGFRKIFLKCEDVNGRDCLTNFYGMNFTTDKLRSLVRKWQTTVENIIDVKTLDGFVLRLFCIGFTKRRQNQVSKTSYAQTSQIRQIRAKMTAIINKHVTSSNLSTLVPKFTTEVIGTEIEKAVNGIYPLQNVFIRKVKLIRAPKLDAGKVAELHAAVVAEDTGAKA